MLQDERLHRMIRLLLKCQVALGIEELSPCGAHMKSKVKIFCDLLSGWLNRFYHCVLEFTLLR